MCSPGCYLLGEVGNFMGTLFLIVRVMECGPRLQAIMPGPVPGEELGDEPRRANQNF
jgi:hypothetical protein